MAENEVPSGDGKPEEPIKEEIETSSVETEKTPDNVTSEAAEPPTPQPGKFKRLLITLWRKKVITIPVGMIVLLAILFVIPFTRYALAGIVLKQDLSVQLSDNSTGKPISNAEVTAAGKTIKTDNAGRAKLKVKVGKTTLKVTKKYYQDYSSSVLVPLGGVKDPLPVKLSATGRQVPVTVTNRITGKAIENALIKAAGTEAKTDKDGKVTIVLPADKAKIDVVVSSDDFNETRGTITVTEQVVKENNFQLTPSGKIYFLSKQSGTIDVVKTNLDGTGRQVVLAGTGKEDEGDTVMLASRDWKYLALKANRDGKEKLYTIDTSNDKLSTVDEGEIAITLVGWSDNYFVYTINRGTVPVYGNKKYALKSYDAKTSQIKVLDETQGEGINHLDYVNEYFSSYFILDKTIAYSKSWQGQLSGFTSRMSGKQQSINTINADGTNKKVVNTFGVPPTSSYTYISGHVYEPTGLYYQVYSGDSTNYYKFENGKLEKMNEGGQEAYGKPYHTYLVSPSDKATFWVESRDGKNTLFIGTADGSGGKDIAKLSEFSPYGWYGDDYLLVSKKGSELYIMPVTGTKDDATNVVKITDYHRPAYGFEGYGYGYGGF